MNWQYHQELFTEPSLDMDINSSDGRLRKFDKVTILLITGCALSMNLPTDYLKDTTCIVKCESPRLNPFQPER